MKIVLTAVAVHDTDANSTAVRSKVESVLSYKGDGTEVIIHDKTQEILWDDTHEIAVRCHLQKAIQRWAETLWGSLEPF